MLSVSGVRTDKYQIKPDQLIGIAASIQYSTLPKNSAEA